MFATTAASNRGRAALALKKQQLASASAGGAASGGGGAATAPPASAQAAGGSAGGSAGSSAGGADGAGSGLPHPSDVAGTMVTAAQAVAIAKSIDPRVSSSAAAAVYRAAAEVGRRTKAYHTHWKRQLLQRIYSD